MIPPVVQALIYVSPVVLATVAGVVSEQANRPRWEVNLRARRRAQRRR